MANNGLKISEMQYSSLEDAVNDDAQVPVAVDINGVKANRRVPIQLIKGYQGESIQGSQGYQGNQGNQGESIQGSQGYQGNQGTSGGGATGNQNRIAFYDASGNLTDSENLIYYSVNKNTIIGDRNAFDDESSTHESTIIGEFNKIYTNANSSKIIGDHNEVNTNNASVIGYLNTIGGGSGSGFAYAFGRLNKVKAPDGMGIGFDNNVGLNVAGVTIGIGHQNIVDGSYVIAVGINNTMSGGNSAVFGNDITLTGYNSYSTVFGNNITQTGDSSSSTIFGKGITLTGKSSYSTVFGNNITLTGDINYSTFFGKDIELNGNRYDSVSVFGNDIYGSQAIGGKLIVGNKFDTDMIPTDTLIAIGSTDYHYLLTLFGRYKDQYGTMGNQNKVLGFDSDGYIKVVDGGIGAQGNQGDPGTPGTNGVGSQGNQGDQGMTPWVGSLASYNNITTPDSTVFYFCY